MFCKKLHLHLGCFQAERVVHTNNAGCTSTPVLLSMVTGLRFNGEATTSTCDDGVPYAYNLAHGRNDRPTIDEVPNVISDSTQMLYSVTNMTTSTNADTESISASHASYAHRDDVQYDIRTGCPGRMRLTPARPSRAGSVFRTETQPVQGGFETGFTFQIIDQSRECTEVKDRILSTQNYQSCRVIGGDGFAFVIHGDNNGSRSIGGVASGIGYDGISNGLAIEFDIWYNTQPGFGDLFYDHVGVHASTPTQRTLRSTADGAIGPVVRVDLADGLMHAVRIVYYGYIKYDLLQYFSINSAGFALLTDDGDQRRLGTLVVYVDDMAVPRLVIPMSLHTVLDVPENQAFMGFTAATGKSWAKHDILEWYFCERPGCPLMTGDPKLLQYRTVQPQ